MNVVQCLSHSIEAYDQLRLYAHLNVHAFDVGGYIDPAHPHDDKRPAVPEMAFFPDLKAAVDSLGTSDNLRAAQERLPDALLDWADVIVFHHYLDRLFGDWPRIERWLKAGSHRRVIWRTVGQSVDGNEATAAPFHNRGLQIVRYSPKERNIPNFAGEDALIRFYKDPAEWTGWTGEDAVVGNVTQELARRDPYTNWEFWKAATSGLPVRPAGPGSDRVAGGIGPMSYDEMRAYLRRIRCYLYTGTQPASYTLGLIEAMMTGVPVVSIGPEHMRIFPYGPQLFEGHWISGFAPDDLGDDHPHRSFTLAETRVVLRNLLEEPSTELSTFQRQRAIDLFGKATIAAQWARFLGIPVREMVAA